MKIEFNWIQFSLIFEPKKRRKCDGWQFGPITDLLKNSPDHHCWILSHWRLCEDLIAVVCSFFTGSLGAFFFPEIFAKKPTSFQCVILTDKPAKNTHFWSSINSDWEDYFCRFLWLLFFTTPPSGFDGWEKRKHWLLHMATFSLADIRKHPTCRPVPPVGEGGRRVRQTHRRTVR